MKAETLPGVGPAMARRIATRLGPDRLARAIHDADVTTLTSIPGVSVQRAQQWIRAATGEEVDERFLATDDARRVGRAALARLARGAVTASGKARIEALAPPADAARRDQTRQQMAGMIAQVRNAPITPDEARQALRAALNGQGRSTRPAQDVIVFADHATRTALQATPAADYAAISGPDDIASAPEYDVAVFVDLGAAPDELPNSVDESFDEVTGSIAAVCPDAALAPWETRRASLEALRRLADAFERPSVAADALGLLDGLPSSRPVKDLDAAVQTVHAELSRGLSEALQACPQADLVVAMTGGTLPRSVREIRDRCVAAACEDLFVQTGVRCRPFTDSLPVRIDEDELDRIKQAAAGADGLEVFRARQKAALRMEALASQLHEELRTWQDQEALLCIALEAVERSWCMPETGSELRFSGAVHLGLDPDRAEPVSYRLGGEHTVALLTGANSGGKSTFLETVAQLVYLARIGLPVPATAATVPDVQEVHIVRAARGLDAGAFETFLTRFLPVCGGDARRLVLVDEVEAITELEAAARILGFVLERLMKTGSLAIVATHLARQVQRELQGVRVDGIEARGLEGDELIIDRSPCIGRAARSTPELIVERLARRGGRHGPLFEELATRLGSGVRAK